MQHGNSLKYSRMDRLNNPFVIYGYKGSEYFCDRQEETEKICVALRNERHVTLISPRRMGKTGLVHHVFEKIRSDEPEACCFYIDIFPTRNLAQFVQMLANEVIGRLDSPMQGVMRRVQEFFGAWRPTVTFDQLTGLPTVSLDIKPDEETATLRQIFEYLRLSGKRCYVAIDEFQQILDYKEKGTEAMLRSYIQFLPNVYFVFSGSKMHVMTEMFTLANRPFFQGTQIVRLGAIDKDKFLDFANGFFCQQSRSIDENSFSYLYNRMNGITYYVQAILNRVYQYKDYEITNELIDNIIGELVEERDDVFQTYLASMTEIQAKVLTAIAKEGAVKEPLSYKFINKYKLRATSSVKTALKNLVQDRMFVYNGEQGYVVYDVFFAIWLVRCC